MNPQLIYYAPTMGKTYASMRNEKLIDFDFLIHDLLEELAEKNGNTVKEMKTNNEEYYFDFISDFLYRVSENNLPDFDLSDKIVMVSNACTLNERSLFKGHMYISDIDLFIERNMARGGTWKESEKWYNIIMDDWNGDSFLKTENKFVTDIYPELDFTNIIERQEPTFVLNDFIEDDYEFEEIFGENPFYYKGEIK